MSQRTLFLAWQDKRGTSRRWFPVGRLDIDPTPMHRFRYIRGALRAQADSGFPPLLEFPDLWREYQSTALFGVFGNRVMARGRPDRLEYLANHGLQGNAEPFEILSVNGGSRITDTYEVFPKITPDADSKFSCRFFLHGWRHVSDSETRIAALSPGEALDMFVEFDNPETGEAVQVRSRDGGLLGWTPRYLVADLIEGSRVSSDLVEDTPPTNVSDTYRAAVVRINDVPAPSSQRLLIELSGRWVGCEPMSGEDFEPLA